MTSNVVTYGIFGTIECQSRTANLTPDTGCVINVIKSIQLVVVRKNVVAYRNSDEKYLLKFRHLLYSKCISTI